MNSTILHQSAERRFRKVLDSGSTFFFASIAAGLLNYLFLVLVARELSPAAFASFNAWFADMALFFIVASLTQYAANFYPAYHLGLRLSTVAINLTLGSMAYTWFLIPNDAIHAKALLVIVAAALFGWLLGQVQIRLMYSIMAAAILLTGITKLSLALIPIAEVGSTDWYRFAFLGCYLPALWLVSFSLWRSSPPQQSSSSRSTRHSWAAPIILSISGAAIPQLDLILVSRLQDQAVFSSFARSSLFYKGIYFLFHILTQWLLPQQIRSQKQSPAKAISSAWPALVAVLGSALITLLSPLVSKWILGWESPPPPGMIFLSCFNMSLLTWVFLLIQEACARRNTLVSGGIVIALTLQAALQFVFQFSMEGYLYFAILFQAGLVSVLIRSLSKHDLEDSTRC